MGAPDRVEKLMALTLADFQRSVRGLVPDQEISEGQAAVAVPVNGKPIHIAFAKRETATLGGLLAMPRACVTLTFDGHSDQERDDFLIRFDRAFQRGGG